MFPERISITADGSGLHINHDHVARALRLLLVALGVLLGRANPVNAQTSLFDPRLDELRRASVSWDQRTGPARSVVDVVCLVPDVPTFLRAVATWDDRHFFPILIDDVEYTFKFLREFRPARIVRFPSKVGPIAPEELWERAQNAVGTAWLDAKSDKSLPRGDVVPENLGKTPPGVVLSTSDSSALPGAVALAAGRFQPLLKWETGGKRFADRISAAEAAGFARSIEGLLEGCGLKYDKLGDDCDFVTLAGDYPYRYEQEGQGQAFDDLILRATGDKNQRWGFAGRLTGDATQSVYRAMCALFLKPGSGFLFNAYSDKDEPWSRYAMGPAAARLGQIMTASHRGGETAGLSGWHKAFDPVNRSGLVLINSSGNPTDFRIDDKGNQAQTADIPESDPLIVYMIHSFSAESPDDPATLAGRWMANGAFVYFGSMNEPYLEAFRAPGAIVAILSDNLPLSAVFHRMAAEPFGQPWRLAYFGDPLYRVRAMGNAAPRVARWAPVDAWKAYVEPPAPSADMSDFDRLDWALKTAIFRNQSQEPARVRVDLHGILLGIARERLATRARGIYDDLLVDYLLHSDHDDELVARLPAVAPSERSASLRRHLETAQTAALQKALNAHDHARAIALWRAVILTAGSRDFVNVFTGRVGRLADEPGRRAAWIEALRKAQPDASNTPVIQQELKRLGVSVSKAKSE
jgi:hypothetical protein